MPRKVRHQGAIVNQDHILLIRNLEHNTGQTYWLLPGGGRDGSETEEQCVVREMQEDRKSVV